MSKRVKILAGGSIAAVILAVAMGAAAWFFFIRSDAPPEVSLAGAINSIATATPSASASASASVSASPPGSPGPGGQGRPGGGGPGGGGGGPQVSAAPSVAAPALPSSGGAAAVNGIAGTWAPDPAQASFVGYRVVEDLTAIGSNTVVGRTAAVTGQVVLTADSVTGASFVADTTQLKSDNSLRDGQLRNQGIEYSKFPTATFTLSKPIALPSGLAAGQPISVTVAGSFTLHGVTKDVSIAAQAQLVGANLVVVGSFKIAFSDYNVTKPRGGPVLSIEDDAVVELQLVLSKQ